LNNGVNKSQFWYIDNKFKKLDVNKGSMPINFVTLYTGYYSNKNSEDFRRKISFVAGKNVIIGRSI